MCIRDSVGSYFLAQYTADKLGNNILNKVTGDIAKQIARPVSYTHLNSYKKFRVCRS